MRPVEISMRLHLCQTSKEKFLETESMFYWDFLKKELRRLDGVKMNKTQKREYKKFKSFVGEYITEDESTSTEG